MSNEITLKSEFLPEILKIPDILETLISHPDIYIPLVGSKCTKLVKSFCLKKSKNYSRKLF